MVIRIDSLQEGPEVVLRVAGSLAGSDVAVLHDSVASQRLPKRIDLSGVEFVDAEGALALLRLEERGVVLTGVEPYVELLLRSSSGPAAGTGPSSSSDE